VNRHIARIFPRRTKATPMDDMVFFNEPGLFLDGIIEAHISVTFTWDLPRAEYLLKEWERVMPTKIGGPAVGTAGADFEPGMYLKPGYVITSRGCPNHCWFCSAWKREGDIREFPIREGWNVLDDNLLACSESHIRAVFDMLKRQPEKAQFTGGLEAARLKDWHIDLLVDLKPKQIFYAHDTKDDYEPLVEALGRMTNAGFNRHTLRVYVLIGFNGDTFEKAERRLLDVTDLGAYPMAMLYRDKSGKTEREWRRFQRLWARPASIYRKLKEIV